MNKHFRIVYLRNQYRAPVGTICLSHDKENDTVYYQISVHNPEDNWKRAIGRQLAIGKLVEYPRSVKVIKDADFHQLTETVMQDLTKKNSNTPTRARNAAILWLKKQTEFRKIINKKPTTTGLSLLDNIIKYESERDVSSLVNNYQG